MIALARFTQGRMFDPPGASVARRRENIANNPNTMRSPPTATQFLLRLAQARQAGVFKSKYKMSYADAIAAALALHKNGHLVTGDREFKHVENDVKIVWLT